MTIALDPNELERLKQRIKERLNRTRPAPCVSLDLQAWSEIMATLPRLLAARAQLRAEVDALAARKTHTALFSFMLALIEEIERLTARAQELQNVSLLPPGPLAELLPPDPAARWD